MLFNFEQTWIDISCPNCKYCFGIQLQDVKLQRTIICHNCKVNIDLIDQNASAHTSINSINHTFTKLNNIFKKNK